MICHAVVGHYPGDSNFEQPSFGPRLIEIGGDCMSLVRDSDLDEKMWQVLAVKK